jgi:hypothetical protein
VGGVRQSYVIGGMRSERVGDSNILVTPFSERAMFENYREFSRAQNDVLLNLARASCFQRAGFLETGHAIGGRFCPNKNLSQGVGGDCSRRHDPLPDSRGSPNFSNVAVGSLSTFS